MDPRSFSTTSASGSTSMAANVIESMEFFPELFLLDEDTCARYVRETFICLLIFSYLFIYLYIYLLV